MSEDSAPIVPPSVPSTTAADAGPTLGDARIDSVDVLRGFALMGILIMNIQSFAMPSDAYFAPTAYGNFDGLNRLIWILGYIFVDMKFMAMFGMLFGAGIVLMSQHRDAAGKPVIALHYRRMLLLLAFGLMHAYIIWYGDILVSYAICGMAVFWMRKWPVRRLIVCGAALIVFGSWIYMLGGFSVLGSEEAAEQFRANFSSTQAEIDEELAAYRGGWLDHFPLRASEASELQMFVLPLIFFWRVCGLMFIGMALFKSGVLSAERSTRFYVWMAILGGGIGLPLTGAGAYWAWSKQFDAAHMFTAGALPNWYGSVGVALMWIALTMLFVRSPFLGGVKSVLGAYGRTAFTNYIGQSVLATAVFYGYGLGLFGSLERTGQIGVVLAIWTVQLAISPIWLRYFRFGPLEWVWRSGVYKQLQPMLRRA